MAVEQGRDQPVAAGASQPRHPAQHGEHRTVGQSAQNGQHTAVLAADQQIAPVPAIRASRSATAKLRSADSSMPGRRHRSRRGPGWSHRHRSVRTAGAAGDQSQPVTGLRRPGGGPGTAPRTSASPPPARPDPRPAWPTPADSPTRRTTRPSAAGRPPPVRAGHESWPVFCRSRPGRRRPSRTARPGSVRVMTQLIFRRSARTATPAHPDTRWSTSEPQPAMNMQILRTPPLHLLLLAPQPTVEQRLVLIGHRNHQSHLHQQGTETTTGPTATTTMTSDNPSDTRRAQRPA